MAEDQTNFRNPRTSVMLTAHLLQPDGTASQHRVVNISATGLCVGQASALSAGMTVLASVGEVDHVPADLVWVRAGNAGLAFRSPIDLAAARRRRPADAARKSPSTGWLVGIDDAYRRR